MNSPSKPTSSEDQKPQRVAEEARSWALQVASDFVSEWDRVYSIIGMMEEALEAEVQKAGDGQMETWMPEEMTLNLYWLRQRLGESAKAASEALGAAGYGTGPRS